MPKRPENKRRFPRYEVEGVGGTFLFTTDVKISNMSADGIGIETNTSLRVGRKYSLKVDMEGKSLRLNGEVVWCSLVRTIKNEKGDIVPVYRAGVRFEEVLTDNGDEWLDFIGKKAVITLERRIFGRFKIEPGAEAQVDCAYDFEAKRISLSGMLVETDLVTDLSPFVDKVIDLNIELSSEVRLATQARVAYVKPKRGDEEVLQLGLEFLNIGAKELSKLREFVQDELEINKEVGPTAEESSLP